VQLFDISEGNERRFKMAHSSGGLRNRMLGIYGNLNNLQQLEMPKWHLRFFNLLIV
jgi:hypothetical protein